ncbi:MAG: DUF309 domain-containing protein [Deltaproteobacteria bacterium]
MAKYEKFDPFNDRQARMVRNRLSDSFIEGLALKDRELVEKKATALLQEHDQVLYHRYVKERLQRYREVHAVLAKDPGFGKDVFLLTSELWDQGLFFEVHELLEGHWSKATGRPRQALQGLIQAAGFYLLQAAGNMQGAARLADKAVSNLAGSREHLPKAMRIEELISALTRRAAKAPPLF